MKQQSSLIPDGITIGIYTAQPPVTYRSSSGLLVQIPFIAKRKLSSYGLTLPNTIHPRFRVDDWVSIPHSGALGIAVLTKTERFGFWPYELLSMVAGHPVPHNTMYLELYASSGELITVTEFMEGGYLSGRVEWNP